MSPGTTITLPQSIGQTPGFSLDQDSQKILIEQEDRALSNSWSRDLVSSRENTGRMMID
ncbi:hypothetical protein [Mesorhizobium sp. M00.F.Ca.ET.216.01.1.1]|uniref:hypothetical protein n=1 Tax=Mesorhizobium sp. M00.F.Ca.ET.216.01.1.1 TaxID=2500528 RepID=UPI0016726CB6|nr:hypothetical protein [Mesorhizobium sp. M00.F.Ca.ET.216.01.1.1]